MLASTRALLSQDALPTTIVFVVVVWLLLRYGRSSRPQPGSGAKVVVTRGERIRGLLATIGGGYLVFVVLTAGISALAGESGRYIRDALAGGAVLAFGIVAPLGAAAVIVEGRLSRRRGRARRSGPA